jgi:ribosomal protein L37AE/L43A
MNPQICPRCKSKFINRTENENPTWQCSDCFYTFEIPLIANFPDLENIENVD